MKSFVVALCIVGCVVASSDPVAVVLRNDYQQNLDSYQYAYETDNGIAGQASAVLKNVAKDQYGFEVTGSNQYKDKDGKVYALNYVANEFGYQPSAEFLPTPPPTQPIPEAIARALAYIAAHPQPVKKA